MTEQIANTNNSMLHINDNTKLYTEKDAYILADTFRIIKECYDDIQEDMAWILAKKIYQSWIVDYYSNILKIEERYYPELYTRRIVQEYDLKAMS